MEVFSLRVKRTQVGNQIPFDRIYLVKHDDRGYIEQMWRAALVMPVDEKLHKMLLSVELDTVKDHPHDRGEEGTEERKPRNKELAKLLKGHWVMVVPILPKWLRENEEKLKNVAVLPDAGHQAPSYLTSPKWYTGKKRGQEHRESSFLPNLSYLQVPGKKIRPVCVACPKMIQHQNGECQIGEVQCYTQLSLGVRNYFKDGAEAPVAPANIKEDENGFVPEVDA